MSRRPSIINISTALSSEDRERLLSNKNPVIIEIPTDWCYHICRSAPPSGWTKKLRKIIKPTIFPQPLDELYWDESIAPDGRWELWGISISRLHSIVGLDFERIFRINRKIRICPKQGEMTSFSAFPNLAPPRLRPLRVPWLLMHKWGIRIVPASFFLLSAVGVGVYLTHVNQRYEVDRYCRERNLYDIQNDLDRESKLIAILTQLKKGVQEDSAWLTDLDELTRLLPEDTHVVDLQWRQGWIHIDIITPNPEAIRDILQASPILKDIKFIGNLDRKGVNTRLTLEMQSRVNR